jgi:hypothetical protein
MAFFFWNNTQSSTGVVVALHGKETSAGNFLVEDVLEAGLPPQTVLPSISNIFVSCIAHF